MRLHSVLAAAGRIPIAVVVALLMILYGRAEATKIVVPTDYSTIQGAIDAATDGDTVQVNAGTYVGVININKSLVVTAAGPGSTTIQAPSDFGTNSAYNYPASTRYPVAERPIVHIGAESPITVVFERFFVDGMRLGPDTLAQVSYSGILAENCDVTIRYDTVTNVLPADAGSAWHWPRTYNGRGIHVRGEGTTALIRNNALSQINRFHILVNATDDTVNARPVTPPYAIVDSNVIIGKGLYAGGQKGIWFDYGAWGRIIANNITGLDYTNSNLEPDRASGIIVWNGQFNSSHNNVIQYNNISSSTSNNNKGIYDWGVRDTIADNTITGFRFGIELHESWTPAVLRNTITGGVMGIVVGQERYVQPVDTVIIGGSPVNKNTIAGQAGGFQLIGGVEKPNGYAISLCFRDPQGDPFYSTVPINARYNDFGVGTSDSVGIRIFDDADSLDIINYYPYFPLDTVIATPFYVPALRASVRAYLQGPYVAAGDSMGYALKTNGTLASHFGARPIPGLAVDSINIELRDSASAAKSTKRLYAPAWLLANGTIRNFDDTTKSYVEFSGDIAGPYYLVVRHRNHLAIMDSIAQTIDGSTAPSVHDFSTAQNKAYGTNPMVLVGTKYAMFTGDANGDGQVTTSDFNPWLANSRAALTGYVVTDFNLDGQNTTSDFNPWLANARSAATSKVP